MFTKLKPETPLIDRFRIEKLDLFESGKIETNGICTHENVSPIKVFKRLRELRDKWKRK